MTTSQMMNIEKPMKAKLKVDDVGVIKKKKRKSTNRMQSAEHANPSHLSVLDPIPSDITDPVEWASEHLKKQIPQAAKELEWALKFGDAKTRRETALELLAFKGISKKTENNGQVVPAINLIMNGNTLPWAQPELPKVTAPELVEGEIVEGSK